MNKTQLCAEYREKYGWEMPSLKLARIISKDNPLLFNKVDTIRSILRQIEGKNKNRVKTVKEMPERPKNPYNLPESDEAVYEPYKLEAKRLLVLSDIHIPYHSIATFLLTTFDIYLTTKYAAFSFGVILYILNYSIKMLILIFFLVLGHFFADFAIGCQFINPCFAYIKF